MDAGRRADAAGTPGEAEERRVLERLAAHWRPRAARVAWRPIVVDGEGPAAGGRFGGRPWLATGEETPRCQGCAAPFALLAQLDLDALPVDPGGNLPRGGGLAQLFYCLDCAEGWAPEEQGQLARVVPAAALAAGAAAGAAAFPARAIVDWTPFADLPAPDEHDDFGLTYEYAFASRVAGAAVDAVRTEATTVRYAPLAATAVFRAIVDVPEEFGAAADGDKLGGWPHWVQHVEYPGCPRCGARLAPLLQLDSEDHLPYMFGDSGCGHLTRCPRCPDVVAFGWACC